ncbi:hypothetical protein [Desulfuribacillus alkaliarsenatis]|uniref:Uncharacterized protein n=1 Tax=Desulfuribacillus alkaliarsenatis TaxID=766136 RepID=A0A1E5FYB1_9FIRM|nr:hypothetical protein [Desulfuribacillus alkaliarsenatis]OEF95563.1 hypothetical protein BHF68_11950 [Desulfuribacillus alkaliarsenatis]
MEDTRALVDKSINFKINSIQNMYLVISKQVMVITELDVFNMQDISYKISKIDEEYINSMDTEYITSLVDILQKLQQVHSFHVKKKLTTAMFFGTVEGSHNMLPANQEQCYLLLRSCLIFIRKALNKRVYIKSINKQDYDFEAVVHQFLEVLYIITRVSFRMNVDNSRDNNLSLNKIDSLSYEIIKLLRCFEEVPLSEEYKAICKKVLLDIKTIFSEQRDKSILEKQNYKKQNNNTGKNPVPLIYIPNKPNEVTFPKQKGSY